MAGWPTVVLLGVVFSLALGQLLFKQSARQVSGVSWAELIPKLLTIPHFWLSLLLYGSATFAWIWVLSRVPLHAAYSFYALTFILVPLLAAWVFGERITLGYWLGVALILAGVVITVRESG